MKNKKEKSKSRLVIFINQKPFDSPKVDSENPIAVLISSVAKIYASNAEEELIYWSGIFYSIDCSDAVVRL